jgi:hypothetical protein
MKITLIFLLKLFGKMPPVMVLFTFPASSHLNMVKSIYEAEESAKWIPIIPNV